MAGSQLRVLVIEDDAEARELLVDLLSPDFDMRSAPDGLSGLEMFARDGADVVLTDESLPGMRGTDVARALKASSPSPFVVLVSGFAHPPGAESCDAVMLKPVHLTRLVALIRSSHASRDAASELAVAW